MCRWILEERVTICSYVDVPLGISWYSLDPETAKILCEPHARIAEKGQAIINCRHFVGQLLWKSTVQVGSLVIDLWHEGFRTTIISRLENTLS